MVLVVIPDIRKWKRVALPILVRRVTVALVVAALVLGITYQATGWAGGYYLSRTCLLLSTACLLLSMGGCLFLLGYGRAARDAGKALAADLARLQASAPRARAGGEEGR